jgi:hypothetical protein
MAHQSKTFATSRRSTPTILRHTVAFGNFSTMHEQLQTTDAPQPGAYVPMSILAPNLDDDSPAGLALEYRPPPVERLPQPLADYVAKSAEAIGCDPSLVAMPALAACASAIGDARAVQVKANWLEFPILWTLCVAPSGALKTPAMKAAMEGLEGAQRKIFEAYRQAEAGYKDDFARWQKSDRQSAEPQPPPLKSYYIGDATLEAVSVLLDANPRGLLQKRDELSGWLGGFDKYSDGNEAAQWLEFHSANSVRIDRKGGDKRTIYLPRALVSVTGTIQEPVLRNLLAGENAKHFDNGLAARFLMAMPPERTREWREVVTPSELVHKFQSMFDDLLSLVPQVDATTGRREPVLIHWAPEAKARFVQFFNTHGKEMRAFKSERLKSAWSKLEAQAARLALVFHVIRHTCFPSTEQEAHVISLGTLEAALAWIEWLKGETRRIYYTLTHAGQTRDADRLIQFVRRNGGRSTARDAARAGAGGRDAAAVEKVMRGLVAAGLGEWETPAMPQGGRPTRHFKMKQATHVCETDETSPEGSQCAMVAG